MNSRYLNAYSTEGALVGFASVEDTSLSALESLAGDLLEATGHGRDRSAVMVSFEDHGREVWRKGAEAFGFSSPAAAFDRPPMRRLVARRIA
jgi:hypothetical protein